MSGADWSYAVDAVQTDFVLKDDELDQACQIYEDGFYQASTDAIEAEDCWDGKPP